MKYIFAILFVVLFFCPSFSMAVRPYAAPKDVDYSIETFEDGNFTKDPEWWVFGNANISIVTMPAKDEYALSIKGNALDWYVGGMGLYLGGYKIDFSQYSSLEMDIYGYGEKSGTLKVELYDDDNHNIVWRKPVLP